MHAVVAAAGQVPGPPDRAASWLAEQFDRADLIIAADGGLVHCAGAAVWPDLVIGDLDSAPAELVEAAADSGSTVVRASVDKDETDLELALGAAVERGAEEITIIGLFGGRVDHELANVALVASRRWAKIKVAALDGSRSLWVVHDRLDLELAVGTTLSLLAFGGDATGITSTGVRWPLHEEQLDAGSPRGVSNIATEPTQRIAVATGTLLVIADRTG